MLAPRAGSDLEVDLAGRQAGRPAEHGHVAVLGVGDRLDEAPLDQVGVVDQFSGIEHGTPGHSGGLQLLGDLVLVVLCGPGRDLGLEFGRVLHPAPIGGETGVLGQLGPAHGLAEGDEHLRGDGHDHHVVVRATPAGGVEVGDGEGSVAAAGRGLLAPTRGEGDAGPHVVRHGLLHGDLDSLPLTGSQLLDVGGDDGQGQLHPGAGVAGGGAGQEGFAVGVAGGRQRPGRGLGHPVEALAVGVGAAEPEALDRGVDHLRVGRSDHVVADVELLDDPGAVVLDDDVELGNESEQEVAPVGGGQVDGHAPLVAVPVEEVVAGHVVDTAGGVASSRGFDLDHVGPEPGQGLGGRRTCLVLRQVQNA